MATRNVTYQFDGYFATFDRQTEQEQVAEIESKKEYLAKFDVTTSEAQDIRDGANIQITEDGLDIQPERGNA